MSNLPRNELLKYQRNYKGATCKHHFDPCYNSGHSCGSGAAGLVHFPFLYENLMARILLNSPLARTSQLPRVELDTKHSRTSGVSVSHLSAASVEARLREKRSTAYVEAITRLDAGGHTHNQLAVQAFMEAIRQELPELSIDQLPQGIVSRCYLGHPYEVHTLDQAGMIIQHYKTWEPLPGSLERARSLSLHPQYAFIEVYADKLIAVTDSGETSLVVR